MSVEIAVAMVALLKGVDIDTVIEFLINNAIDNVVVARLPDEIRECTSFKMCMIRKGYDDIKRVLIGERTDVNSIDCLSETLGKCVITSEYSVVDSL